MTTILRPAVMLMGRLSYPQKMSLIALIFLTPLAVVTYLLNAELNTHIGFAQQERLGIEYAQQIRKFLLHVPEHRGMAGAFLNGDAAFKDKLLAKQAEIKEDIRIVDEAEQRLGATLQTSERWNSIKDKWTSLQEQVLELQPKKSYVQHTALIADVLALLEQVGDTSNLVLDSELDSYYLAQALLSSLPNLAEHIGQVRAKGVMVAAHKAITPDERAELANIAGEVALFLEKNNGGLQTVYRVNASIKDQLSSASREVEAAVPRFLEMVDNNLVKADLIEISTQDYFTKATQTIGVINGFYDDVPPVLDALLQARINKLSNARNLALSLIAAATLLVLYLFRGFYSSVMQGISALEQATAQFADGDLSANARYDGQDELARVADAFNRMASHIKHVIEKVSGSTSQLASAAEEMSAVTEQTSQGVLRQQNEIDQVATAMNEMTATVQEVARNAEQASNAAQLADQAAKNGTRVATEAMRGIDALVNEVEKASGVIHQLEVESGSIGMVLDVIKGIAEQTNLLALNAAIEAARAGEQGRGFAVVADEVRTLASRTQKSTQEIRQMIEGLQADASNAVRVMDQAHAQGQEGVGQVEKAAAALAEIAKAVATINDMNTQIASASEEQSAVAEEINRNVVNISQVSSQTAQGSEQSALASNDLARLALGLQDLVAMFKV